MKGAFDWAVPFSCPNVHTNSTEAVGTIPIGQFLAANEEYGGKSQGPRDHPDGRDHAVPRRVYVEGLINSAVQ